MNGIFDKNSKTGISSVESTPHPSCKGSTFQTVKWASNGKFKLVEQKQKNLLIFWLQFRRLKQQV